MTSSNNSNHNENSGDGSSKNNLIRFDNSPLVLYHHHDDEYKLEVPPPGSNSAIAATTTLSDKKSVSSQWEEFIVHLSRWNVLKKYRVIIILLSLVHYFLFIGSSNSDGSNSLDDHHHHHWYHSPRIIIIGLCWMYMLYSLVSSTVSESIVAMKGKGIQLEKTTFLGLKTHQLFIPLENIKYVAISEGFHIDCVIYYLAIVLKQPYKDKMVIVPFEMFNPRLNLLRKVYPKLKRVLFDNKEL